MSGSQAAFLTPSLHPQTGHHLVTEKIFSPSSLYRIHPKQLHGFISSVIRPTNYNLADNKYVMNELTCFLARLHLAGFQFKHRDLSLKRIDSRNQLSLTNERQAISELW